MKSLGKLFLFASLLVGCSTGKASKFQGAFEFENKRPIIAAHRAEHSIHSENSIEAIKAASQQVIPLIEIDIRESLEGELFLFHNRNIDVQTVQGPREFLGRSFSSLTAEQIRSLILPKGERVPSFDEVVAQSISNQSSLLLDIKGGEKLRKKIIDAIRSRSKSQAFWFLCYDPSCISQVRAAEIPKAEAIARIGETLSIAQALSLDPKIVQIDCYDNCLETVSQVKSQTAALILVKTLKAATDNLDNWKRLIRLGVDIILSDKPLELKLLQMR